MSAYEFKNIPELTEEEKQSPYAQFYYEPILPPPPEILEAIQPGKPMDPSLALAPQDIGKLFIPGSLKTDNGYCLLPDGTGFSIIHTQSPESTPEMEKWWWPWMTSSDYDYLNYKIWMPSLHFSHAIPIYEDLGWGPLKLHPVKLAKAEDLDLPGLPRDLNPDYFTLVGAAIRAESDTGDEQPYNGTLVHYMTFGEKGLDVITCVWSGVHILDGKPVRMIEEDEKVNPEHVRLFATHNAWEFTRKHQLLPKLYEFSKTLEA